MKRSIILHGFKQILSILLILLAIACVAWSGTIMATLNALASGVPFDTVVATIVSKQDASETTVNNSDEDPDGSNVPENDDVLDTPWYRSKLDDNEKTVYDEIRNGIDSMSEKIRITANGISEDDLKKIYQYVSNDDSGIFWIGLSFSYDMDSNGSITSVSPEYTLSSDERNMRSSDISKKEDEAVAFINDSGASSDYDKVRNAYKWVCDNIRYDEAAENSQTITGAFVDGTTACAGYSKAMQELCSRIGIQCVYVSGTADTGDSNQVAHAWNVVCLNGTNVYLDVTWGDRDDDTPIDYSWLGLTLDDIAKTHHAENESIIPNADNNAYEIWSLTGGRFGEYDQEKVYSRLAESIGNGDASTSIRFKDDEDLETAYSYATGGAALASRIGLQFIDKFSQGQIYSVYKNSSLDAMTFIWKYR